MSRPTILVTDGEQRASLAVTRSLGAAGYRVIVVAESSGSLAGASRFAHREIRAGPPGSDPWVQAIRAIVRAWDVKAIVPVTEPAMLGLLPAGSEFEGAVIAGPAYEDFAAVSDKQALLERASGLGIEVPRQTIIETPADRAEGRAESVGFPLVIKPARSTIQADGNLIRTEVRYAASHDALSQQLALVPAAAYPVLLQEYVRGPGIGIFALIWAGRTLARFAHRRIREKPPTGGVSVCSESIPLPEGLTAQALRLLDSYSWRGVAMVEFKLDEPTGRAVLMEVNGRFWGSLQLAILAGIDFPRLLVEAALGLEPAPVTEFRAGVRNHWEWGEVDAALLRVRRPDPIAGSRSSAWRVLRDCLALRPGRDRAEVFRLTDALPFLRETIAWLRRA